MPPVTATVTELPDSRVRVEAEVPAQEVERRLQQAARTVARDMRVPGFRKGKVPPPVVLRRVGREALLDEAVREGLGGWYAEAIDVVGVETIGEPKLDLSDLPGEGEPLRFSVEVGVRPTATLGEYKDLEVARREPQADPEAIDAEVQALREKLARLETVERPAEMGDFVVIDFVGSIDGEPFGGGEGRDELVELGSGRLVGTFEEQLAGASAGEERPVTVAFPDDYRAEALAGREASFEVTLKEVKRKEVPEPDDEFATEAAGFDTLVELREDIATRLRGADEARVDAEFREAAVDAVAVGATIELPEDLVEARAREVWEQTAHSLSHQGLSKEMYLQISGKTEDEIVQDARPDAEQALRREAVLAAVVQAEGIQPDDEELLHAVGPSAEREGTKPDKLLARLRDSGRLGTFSREVAMRKAVDLLAESAKPVPVVADEAQDEAGGKLWTPESEEPAGQASGGLWTPGS